MKKLSIALITTAFLSVGALFADTIPWKNSAYRHVLISNRGSSRATAYSMTPKMAQKDGLVHFVYTNDKEESIVRTYDIAHDSFSPEVILGSGADNHSDPGIIIDRDGYLHVFFGPHHAPLQYRKSILPNDSSRWTSSVNVGVGATYASIVCDEANTLHLVYRGGEGSFGQKALYYQQKTVNGSWSTPRKLVDGGSSYLISYDITLNLGPNLRDLYISYNYFNSSKNTGHLIGLIKSTDAGRTWASVLKVKHPNQDAILHGAGTTVPLPQTPPPQVWPNLPKKFNSQDKWFSSLLRKKPKKTPSSNSDFNAVAASLSADYRAANFVIDQDGTIYLLIHDYAQSPKKEYIYKIADGKIDQIITLNDFFFPSKDFHSSANLSLIGKRLYLATQYSNLKSEWSDNATGIALFEADVENGDLSNLRLSEVLPPVTQGKGSARFLPAFERFNGHNELQDRPFLLYTEGTKSGGLETDSPNRVYFAIPNPL